VLLFGGEAPYDSHCGYAAAWQRQRDAKIPRQARWKKQKPAGVDDRANGPLLNPPNISQGERGERSGLNIDNLLDGPEGSLCGVQHSRASDRAAATPIGAVLAGAPTRLLS
jgi:hypothetical protein